MSLKVKLLVSVGTLSVAGGAGGGIYYMTKEKEFSGSLIFDQKNKGSEDTKKIYWAELSTNQEGFSGEEICKLDDKKLSCKISNLPNKSKVDEYLTELNKKLEELVLEDSEDNSEDLKEKLKNQLETDAQTFKDFFDEAVLTSIKKLVEKKGS